MNNVVLDGLKQGNLFSDLSEGELQPVISAGRLKRFKLGEYLFRYEDEADHAFLITQGRVSVYRWTPEGETKKFHTFTVGDMVAEAAMFMRHGLYPMNARAEADTEVFAIPRAVLREICLQQPDVALKLIESMGQRLLSLVNRVDQLSSSSAGRTFASWLVEQCKGQSEPVALTVNRQELAVQLGIAPETLSRLLNKYRTSGLIRGQRGRIEICDVKGLLAMEQL